MGEHPIHGLIEASMQSIKDMIDVNTIIGDPVETPDGTVIIPVSRVGFGFAAGGSDFPSCANKETIPSPVGEKQALFGGGSGAGVSVKPVAFLVVGQGQIKLLSVGENNTTVVDKLFEYIPQMIDKVNGIITEHKEKKEKETE